MEHVLFDRKVTASMEIHAARTIGGGGTDPADVMDVVSDNLDIGYIPTRESIRVVQRNIGDLKAFDPNITCGNEPSVANSRRSNFGAPFIFRFEGDKTS